VQVLRDNLLENKTLAAWADEYEFMTRVVTAQKDILSTKAQFPVSNFKATLFEAYIGASHTWNGADITRKWVVGLFNTLPHLREDEVWFQEDEDLLGHQTPTLTGKASAYATALLHKNVKSPQPHAMMLIQHATSQNIPLNWQIRKHDFIWTVELTGSIVQLALVGIL
jgi:hypothetical protein